MAQPRNRTEPTWGLAPVVGQPCPHTENAGQTLAEVGTTAAATLKQVFEESLDLLADPNASAEDKARAKARLRAGLECNETIAQAQGDFAQGRVAQSQMFGQSREGFTRTTTADEFSKVAAEHFSRSRENLTRASEGLGLEPALAKVLEKAGQTVSGFFQGVGRAAVSLQALASRALAFPGMVRNKLGSGVDRVEDAVQGALDDFHAATAQRVDQMRDKAAEISGAVYDRVVAAQNGVKTRVDAVRDGMNSRIDAVVDNVNSKVDAAKTGVGIGVAGVTAAADVVDSRLFTPLREWLSSTALPAIKEFATEFEQEFNNRFEQRKSENVSFGSRLATRNGTAGGVDVAEPTVPKTHGMS